MSTTFPCFAAPEISVHKKCARDVASGTAAAASSGLPRPSKAPLAGRVGRRRRPAFTSGDRASRPPCRVLPGAGLDGWGRGAALCWTKHLPSPCACSVFARSSHAKDQKVRCQALQDFRQRKADPPHAWLPSPAGREEHEVQATCLPRQAGRRRPCEAAAPLPAHRSPVSKPKRKTTTCQAGES